MFYIVVMENFGCADFVSNPGAEYSIYGYTYVTQNAHALTHAHEIATKQRHNKQSFSLSLKLKHYCSEYYGTQRTRKQAKEGPRTPSRN